MWLAFAVGAKLAADRDDARSDRGFLQIQRIQLYGEFFAQVDTTVALMTDYFPTGDKAGTPYSELPSPNPEQYNEVFSPGIRASSKGAVGTAGQGGGKSLATSITAARRGSRHVALGTSAGTCA